MLQAILPFLTAIALSAIAAFYSVIGLAQIFPGSFWPIILMGSVLEVAKLVTVSWLYNNWIETNRLMKTYFIVAIILLMAITSMGIFGFLSRAHIQSNIVVGANSVQIKTLNTQEKIAKDRLEYLLKRAGDPTTASNKIDKQIQDTQVELTRLSKEKLPLMTEENKLTAEIGPIKYIAEIFYNKDDAGFIDKAVRLVIFTIIIVFDPLAMLLLIASNQTHRKLKILPEEIPIVKKARKKKRLDNQPSNSLESFYVDGETHELIPKNKITTLDGDGGSF
jgi:predicted Holliday junction resolvase-like endonuclease